RPVAAADYFLSNSVLAWFATKVIGIVPIRRSRDQGDPLAPCDEAIADNAILIFFPEGTRGEPEQRGQFKKGIAYLAQKFPEVPITPVFIHGLGKSLPRGEALLVPFFCDVIVGEPFFWEGDIDSFSKKVEQSILELEQEGDFPQWS
ncbi:MAG: 1-acyl-sn-glycerol-3-phosphate acyltransferase, partial [Bdellovibrionales bacterium]|nr:1-acyl-sn-glycerol-3-phosphate acyltransferase [Bdellovibrionales bacterium]